jgi:hypothetical protein
MEVAVGLEPTKTGFAGQRLDHFGIATPRKIFTRIYTQNCTRIARTTPIYVDYFPSKPSKP